MKFQLRRSVTVDHFTLYSQEGLIGCLMRVYTITLDFSRQGCIQLMHTVSSYNTLMLMIPYRMASTRVETGALLAGKQAPSIETQIAVTRTTDPARRSNPPPANNPPLGFLLPYGCALLNDDPQSRTWHRKYAALPSILVNR